MQSLLRFILAACTLSSGAAVPALAQHIDWLTYTSTHGSNLVPFTTVDPSGNSLLAFEYSGGITVGGQSFFSYGSEDVVLAKFDTAGTLVWAIHFGNTSDDIIHGLECDQDGNIYLGMYCSGFTPTFYAADTVLTLQSTTNRTLLMKISPAGNFVKAHRSSSGWRFGIGGAEVFYLGGSVPGGQFIEHLDQDLNAVDTVDLGSIEMLDPVIDVNPAGYLLLAGSEYTNDVMIVQGDTVPNDPVDENEGIVLRFDLTGSLQWVRCFGPVNTIWGEVRGAAVGDDGRVYLATTNDTLFAFAGSSFPAIPGYQGILGVLLAFDAAGNEDWAIPAYSTAYQGWFWDVIVDLDGNVVASADVIPSGLVNGVVVTGVARPYVLLKLDPAGNMIWLKQPIPVPINPMSSPVFSLGQGPDGAYYGGGFGRFFDIDCIDLGYISGWRYFMMRVEEGPWVQPLAGFTWNDVGLDVQFTDVALNATTWDWDFGDGGSDSVASPFHTYTGNGTYVVELTASFGVCSDTSSDTLFLFGTGQVESDTGSDLILTAMIGSLQIQRTSTLTTLVHVIDAVGRTVARHRVGSDPVTIPVSSGVYSVLCERHDRVVAKRVVVP